MTENYESFLEHIPNLCCFKLYVPSYLYPRANTWRPVTSQNNHLWIVSLYPYMVWLFRDVTHRQLFARGYCYYILEYKIIVSEKYIMYF